jgi:hypothetical protein
MTDRLRPGSAPMSIQQQAEFIDSIATRCVMSDGTPAHETIIILNASEAADLSALAKRLYRMAPHEDRIRRLVVGR